MGTVKLQTFYPNNGEVKAAEVNANNNALEGSLGGLLKINEGNIRAEGIDRRNLSENLTVLEINRLNNGYQVSTSTVVAAGARYNSASVDVNQYKESAINHDAAGNTNTLPSKGTKMRVNGTAGEALTGGELVRVNHNVTVHANVPNAPIANLANALIDTTTKDGGTGATYPYGSGVGEWCWCIYPKFNVTSNALNDADFTDAKTAGLITTGNNFFDPLAIAAGIPSPNAWFADFDDIRFDHVLVVPDVFFSASNVSTSPFLMINSGASTGGTTNGQLGGPQMFNTSFQFKVSADVAGGKRLYGIQLYVSGYWRIHGNTSGSGNPMNAGLFLESEPCNPSRVNASGDPIPQYGVNGAIHLERVQSSVLIHRPQVA